MNQNNVIEAASNKTMPLASAIKDFFNIPTENMMREYKALSADDKAEIKAGLEQNGYIIVEHLLRHFGIATGTKITA